MKSAGSLRPLRESAASCKPTIQPSVRCSSVATASAGQERPVALCRNASASSKRKRRSSLRSSLNCPRLRQRARGIRATGQDKVHLGGKMVEQEGEGLVDWGGLDDVVVIQHQHHLLC